MFLRRIHISLIPLEYRRNALAHTNAHCCYATLETFAAHLVQQRTRESSTARAQRMSYCNRTTIGIHFRRVETQIANDRQALRCECFVEFEEIDVFGLQFRM